MNKTALVNTLLMKCDQVNRTTALEFPVADDKPTQKNVVLVTTSDVKRC